MKHFTTAIFLLASLPLFAQNKWDSAQNWNFHFQQTIVTQYHFPFHAKYSGPNSMDTSESWHTSLTSTVFYGHQLWKGAALYFNPEIAGGTGLSRATGMAGFPNGETFRVGNPMPQFYMARLFLQQYFPLGKEYVSRDDEPNQLAGRVPEKYLFVDAGRFSLADYFDNNTFSHDPRTQFLNWSLMSAGAWDYAANTRGYTYGIVCGYQDKSWEFRLSTAMMPEEANGAVMDRKYLKANSETAELQRNYSVAHQEGSIRLLGFISNTHMGSYQEAITDSAHDITATRMYGRSKFGVVLNLEQALDSQAGVFARFSWNDGHNETWAFTEIDRSAQIGGMVTHKINKNIRSETGLAFVMNGISKDHRNYLAAGGTGFMVGDGRLNYAAEMIAELYFKLSFQNIHLELTPDYQFAMNPAYNKDRGPIHIFALRAHFEY